MRGINYLAALGTVLVFMSVFGLKAAFEKKRDGIGTHRSVPPMKPTLKLLLILCSAASMIAGFGLLAKAFKLY